MNVAYFDCRGGLSVQAALAALREAAGAEPVAQTPANLAETILAGLGPCPPEEKEALYAFDHLLQALAVKTVHFSPLPLARLAEGAAGFLAGVPVQGDGGPVTVAGAALVRALNHGGDPPFLLKASGTGRGRGALVRAYLGGVDTGDEVVVLETNLDDFNTEFHPHLSDLLLTAGALDVFLTPVIMKKGRPGTMITVLAPPDTWRDLARVILDQSTSLGVRSRRENRLVLPRRLIEVATPYGTVRAKVAECPDGRRKVKPEYEDCRKIALAGGLPLTEVYREALAAAWRLVPAPGKETTGKNSGAALADE